MGDDDEEGLTGRAIGGSRMSCRELEEEWELEGLDDKLRDVEGDGVEVDDGVLVEEFDRLGLVESVLELDAVPVIEEEEEGVLVIDSEEDSE